MNNVVMVLGWLVLLIPGVLFSGAGLLLFLMGPSFNGKFNVECLFPVAIGCLLLWGAYEANPFTVTMK